MFDEDHDAELISIFAEGTVWFNYDVIVDILDSPELLEGTPEEIVEGLKELFYILEKETVKSIADSMVEEAFGPTKDDSDET